MTILKGKGNAPPAFLALLWHHFCYYKRHWIKLIITVLLPIVSLGFLIAITWLITKDANVLVDKCEFPVYSPLSAGPLASGKIAYPCETSTMGGWCLHNSSSLNFVHQKVLNVSKCDRNFIWRGTDRICDLFENTNLLYYPSNSSSATPIMTIVKKMIDAYFELDDAKLLKLGFPKVESSCKRNSIEAIPFTNRQAAISYAEELNLNISKYEKGRWKQTGGMGTRPPSPVAIVSFQDSGPKALNYRIIFDPAEEFFVDNGRAVRIQEKVAAVQDLVENAFIRLQNNHSKPGFATALKEIPQPCWEVNDSLLTTFIVIFAYWAVIFSFIMSPINFLDQVLTEKSLKLREYLYIMGIGSIQHKLSWITFYGLFLFPLSIIVSLMLMYLPGHIFRYSDTSIIFVIIFLYNICQLNFCYMLSSFLQTPRRTGILLIFISMFFLVLSVVLFKSNNIAGGQLILARFCSLHFVTPMVIAFSYIGNWENIWIGAQWKNSFYSPMLSDGYGGIGECLLWFLGDMILYLIVAWYLEKVMPGTFGVKHPVYFLFQPSYWLPNRFKSTINNIDLGTGKEANIELVGMEHACGVELNDLTKVYSKTSVGINRLSLKFYQNEITAFLGENGAGKSTTLNILVGLISPTMGSATVKDYSTNNQIDKIRDIVGFVPQYDILYPSMTIREHFQFYGWLKGLSKNETMLYTEPLLKSMDLSNHKNTIITKLSGGQKRKVSLITAYLGNPEVIILDEPTSGVDPFSRRVIWEMILNHRKRTTTILSTHFMEEADILGDKIAVISQGELVCNGTPMYLKRYYGKGLQVITACKPESSKEEIKQFVSSQIPDSKISQEKGNDISFVVPPSFAHSPAMVTFLKLLETNLSQLNVVSYGLSEPTLENVFFAAIDSPSATDDSEELNPEIEDSASTSPVDESTLSNDLRYDSVIVRYLWQCWGLFQKKVLSISVSLSILVLQVLLPLAFILLLLTVGNKVGDSGTTVQLTHIWTKYRSNAIFIQDSSANANKFIERSDRNGFSPRCPGHINRFGCSASSKGFAADMLKDPNEHGAYQDCKCPWNKFCTNEIFTTGPHLITRSTDVFYRINSKIDPNEWLFNANSTKQTVVGGFQFNHINATKWELFRGNQTINETYVDLTYVTVWYKRELRWAMVNVWNNFLLQQTVGSTDAQIRLETEAVSLNSHSLQNLLSGFISELFSSVFLIFCFAFGTFGITVLMQQENSTGLKRLQMLFGANPIIYWLINLACDFLLFMLTVTVSMLLLGVTDNQFKAKLNEIMMLVVPFGYLSITFMHLLSFVFQKSQGIIISTVVSTILFLGVGFAMAGLEIFQTICQKQSRGGSCNFGFASSVSNVLRVFPGFFISDGIFTMIFHGFTSMSPQSKIPAITSMEFFGKRILTAFIVGTVYFLIVLLLESLDLRVRSKCCNCKRRQRANQPCQVPQTPDQDVRQEEHRVSQLSQGQDPLVLKHLTKWYRGGMLPAVNDVSLGIQSGQCFGLLGINGAGKTTLFRMLTGYQRPTSGGGELLGKNIFSRGWSRLAGSSYCPQDNTLFDGLSARRHLKLFGKLRGIPKSQLDSLVKSMIAKIGLKPHASKRAQELSGGNMRKLQFAMSLLGDCPVIFLDEPTTGMDPGARRKAWTMIREAVSRGSSVVLTSHSMEECEALCHRLGITHKLDEQFVKHEYLKDKFGNKYTFKIKIDKNLEFSKGNPAELVKEFILKQFPAELIEEHSSMLHFELSAEDMKLSNLFEALVECKNRFPIEDFSVSQITLEHVFVNMAKMQENLQPGMVLTIPPEPAASTSL